MLIHNFDVFVLVAVDPNGNYSDSFSSTDFHVVLDKVLKWQENVFDEFNESGYIILEGHTPIFADTERFFQVDFNERPEDVQTKLDSWRNRYQKELNKRYWMRSGISIQPLKPNEKRILRIGNPEECTALMKKLFSQKRAWFDGETYFPDNDENADMTEVEFQM